MQAPETILSIGKLASQAGLNPSAIRYYESVGLLPPAKRLHGQRYYGEDALQKLSFIKFAQQAGFTIPEITTFLAGFTETTPPATRWRKLAEHKLPEVEDLIVRAQKMKVLLTQGMECGCSSLAECLPLIDSDKGCGVSQPS